MISIGTLHIKKVIPYFFSHFQLHVLIISLGAFLLPFIYSESLVHKAILPKYAFIACISLLSFLSWFFHSQKKNILQFNNLLFLLITIYLFSAISIIWSEFTGTYVFEIINFSCLLLLSFTCLQISKFKDVLLVLTSLVFGGAIIVIVTFIQIWGWNPLSYVIQGFPAASFINKNYLANYVDLLIPICFALLLVSKTTIIKWFHAFFISVFYSFIIVSHTRASWLSLAIILFIILYFSGKHLYLKNKFTQIPAPIIIFILLFTSTLSLTAPDYVNESNRFSSLFSSSTTNSSSQRLRAYKSALNMIQDRPVAGFGLGSFYTSFKPYKFVSEQNNTSQIHFLQLHNDLLQFFVELGFIGGLLWISFIVLIIYRPYKKLSLIENINEDKKILYFSLLISLISSWIHSLLSFPLHLPASSFIIFISFGLLLNINSQTINQNKKISSLFIFIILSLPYFLFILYTSYVSSSYNLNNAIKSIYIMSSNGTPSKLKHFPPHKDNCEAAKRYTDNSLDLFKNDFYTNNWAPTLYSECVTDKQQKIIFAEKLLQNDPYHFSALEMAAFIYFHEKKYEKAGEYINQLHRLYPLNSRYTLWQGHIAAKLKNYKQAIAYYRDTIQLEPNNKTAQEMLLKIKNKLDLN